MRYQRYTTNYGGPLRKASLSTKGLMSGGSSMQLFATVLSDVCYRLHGAIVGSPSSGSVNRRHHLQDLFTRRIRNGQCFRTPCLGWSEFTCSYWGPFREGVTEVDDALSQEVPSMLLSIWSKPVTEFNEAADYFPTFHQDVKLEKGALQYAVPKEWMSGASLEERTSAQ